MMHSESYCQVLTASFKGIDFISFDKMDGVIYTDSDSDAGNQSGSGTQGNIQYPHNAKTDYRCNDDRDGTDKPYG